MKEIIVQNENIDRQKVASSLKLWLDDISFPLKKVLLLPPDITRMHSKAGLIVELLYQMLSPYCQVDIMPALGTHIPMNDAEKQKMFGSGIPVGCFLVHDWRKDLVKLGVVPAEYVRKISDGLVEYPVEVEVNRNLLDRSYDLIVSIGQVVPHEVVGMANYNKNIMVGCGGADLINKSHFLGAVYGMEKIMGRDHSPVRQVFDYAEAQFLRDLPLQYILTVTNIEEEETKIRGLFIGRSRKLFEEAVVLSQKYNLDLLDQPLSKVVVYLDPQEFKSTWLGNKAIYRTRMAIADGGHLVILAPGVKQFGEDSFIDQLIRKFGYVGYRRILQLVETEPDLKQNLSAAAHLVHGSSEGRFQITYAPGSLNRAEVEGVNFNYLSLNEAMQKYHPESLHNGINILENGEEIYYIDNPALGLWALKDKFK